MRIPEAIKAGVRKGGGILEAISLSFLVYQKK